MAVELNSDSIVKCNLCGKEKRYGDLLVEILSMGFRLYCSCDDRRPIFCHYNRGWLYINEVVSEPVLNRAIIIKL